VSHWEYPASGLSVTTEKPIKRLRVGNTFVCSYSDSPQDWYVWHEDVPKGAKPDPHRANLDRDMKAKGWTNE
jgi:hypothetical protein